MPRPKGGPGWGGKKEPEEPYIDYKSIKRLAKTGKKFEALVFEHREITDQEAAFRKRKEEIKDELVPLMIAANHRRVQAGNRRILMYEGHSKQISGKKLLENGVASDVIVKSTVTSTYQAIRTEVVEDEVGFVSE